MSEPLDPRNRGDLQRYLERLRTGCIPPLYRRRDCPPRRELHLVSREFRFRGKGRDVVVKVTLQWRAMVMLLEAMLRAPTIQVTTTTFGSYRSCELQRELWDRYRAGTGYLAAPPGRSGHNQGLCVDLYKPTKTERKAMLAVGWHDLLPEDPPHFNAAGRY